MTRYEVSGSTEERGIEVELDLDELARHHAARSLGVHPDAVVLGPRRWVGSDSVVVVARAVTVNTERVEDGGAAGTGVQRGGDDGGPGD